MNIVSHVHARLSALKYRYGHKATGCVPVRIIEEEMFTGKLQVVCEAWMPEGEAKQFVFDHTFNSGSRREYAACVSHGWMPCITLDPACCFTLQAGEGGI